MYKNRSCCTFYVSSLMKQSRPNYSVPPLEFLAFPHNLDTCVEEYINNYLEKTKEFRPDLHKAGLFLNHANPHKTIKSRSISRYVCKLLEMAGIDIKTFTAHSTRGASTSAATLKGLSLDEINRAAGWSNSKTFQKHYSMNVRT